MKKTDTFADRRQEAEAAKNRRLEKFKAGSDKDSPEAVARASARQAESAARAERKAAADLDKKDKAEKLSRAAEAELKRAAEAAEAQSILDEASRKAKRDARYANRKARS